MNDLDNYIDKLIAEKGFDEKDEDVLDQMKADLKSRLEDRIDAMVIASLSENDLPLFEKVLDSENAEEIEKFTREHIPDISERIANELLNFRSIYLS